MDSEFLTVTTYHDAVVPEWIAISHSADTYYGDDVRRAFKEGVEAALNIECKGECAKPKTPIAPRVLQPGSEEPPRDTVWMDRAEALWRYGVAGNGAIGWYFHRSAYPWEEVGGPLTEVV